MLPAVRRIRRGETPIMPRRLDGRILACLVRAIIIAKRQGELAATENFIIGENAG